METKKRIFSHTKQYENHRGFLRPPPWISSVWWATVNTNTLHRINNLLYSKTLLILREYLVSPQRSTKICWTPYGLRTDSAGSARIHQNSAVEISATDSSGLLTPPRAPPQTPVKTAGLRRTPAISAESAAALHGQWRNP